MATSNLVRLGALAAMMGSGSYAMANLALWVSEPPVSEIIRRLDRDRMIQTLDNIFHVFLVVGALAAIASLYTQHRELYGMTGALASLVAFGGLVLSLVAGLGDVLRQYSYVSSPLSGVMLVGLGGIGLGVATVAARVLPWWCGVALMLGSFGFAFAALFGELWGVVVGSSWALVGYAVFGAANRSQRPSRAR